MLDERPDLGQHGSGRGRVALGQAQPDQGKARQHDQRRRVAELARGGQPFGRQRQRRRQVVPIKQQVGQRRPQPPDGRGHDMLASPGQGRPAGGQRLPVGTAQPLDVDLLGGRRQAALDQAGRSRGRRRVREGLLGPVELAQRERGLPQAEAGHAAKGRIVRREVGQRPLRPCAGVLRRRIRLDRGHVGARGGDRPTRGAGLAVGCRERACGRVDPGGGRFQLDTVDQEPGLGQAEQRPGAHDRLGEGGQPGRERLVDAHGGEHRGQQGLDPGRRILGGAAGQRVVDRFREQAFPAEPAAGPPVEGGHRLGAGLAGQPGAQHVGEQVVVAVPDPLVVQRHQEQVGPLQLLQDRLAVPGGGGQQRIAQRGAQPVEHAGGQQKASGRGRPAVQHLGRQVVGHQAVPAGEGGHERRRVGPVAQRQPGQLEPGRPALGALDQRRHLRVGQAQPHATAQERGRLLDAESQVGGAQLGELVAGTEARQGQRRVLTAGDHQVQRRWQVVEQEGDRGMDVRSLHQVVVVQDQQTGGGQGGQVVDQAGDHNLRWRRLRGVEPGHRPAPTGRSDRLQGGDQVAEEPAGVLVALVEGEPGGRAVQLGEPGRQQAGLAGTGRRREQRAPTRARADVEAGQQPGPRDQVATGPGHEQLGRQQGETGGAPACPAGWCARSGRRAAHELGGGGGAPGQGGGRLGQAVGREVLGPAQVDLVLAASGRAVGDPVGAAPLAALLARGVGPRRRPERERPGGVVGQPREPGRRADGQSGPPASRGCLQQPVRHRGDLRHPLPHIPMWRLRYPTYPTAR